jgi:hypothetical protein
MGVMVVITLVVMPEIMEEIMEVEVLERAAVQMVVVTMVTEIKMGMGINRGQRMVHAGRSCLWHATFVDGGSSSESCVQLTVYFDVVMSLVSR